MSLLLKRSAPLPIYCGNDLRLPFNHLQLRYANNSNYKNDSMIRKEMFVSSSVIDELKRIVKDSEVRVPRQLWDIEILIL